MKILLVDANGYLHRAFHALRAAVMTNSKGQPTGALFGFARTLQKILREQKPEFVAVCFDSPGPTFRHKQFADYKGTRKETDEELVWQLPRAQTLAQAWGLHPVALAGYEADDLIATLARRAREQGAEVLIVTADKDALQLVDSHVRVLNEAKGEVLDSARVAEKFGVPPERIVDYLTLVGDSSDNVPGVRGIGPKGAVDLLTTFGSLDAVLAAPAGAGGKLAKHVAAVQAARDTVMLARKLIELERNAPIPGDLSGLKTPKDPDPALLAVLKDLEFTSLIEELFQAAPPAAEAAAPVITVDWRALGTTGALALAFGEEGLALSAGGKTALVRLEEVSAKDRKDIQDLLASDLVSKSGHDLKTISKALRARGFQLGGPQFDTMLAGYCLNPSRSRYAFADLVFETLNRSLPPGPAAEAAAVDELAARQAADLRAKGLWDLFRDLEMPLVEILADMETAGIMVDRPYLSALRTEFSGRIAALQQELYALAGSEINLNSPKQIGALLFDKFKLPPQRKTKTGYSTDEEVLRFLSPAHPFPAKLLDYRELAKLQSTYVDALLEQADAGGRVHTQFLQTGAATGRLSSTGPNLQNIPIRTSEGVKVRHAFIAAPGHVLLSADYSQIDLRVLAHLTGDPALCAAFAAGDDVHARTAAEVFHVAQGQVTPEQRRLAKAINFGIAYGQTPHGLSEQLGITMAEAQEYIKRYMERYAGVAAYIKNQVLDARKEGAVHTLLGRIRYLPELASKNGALRGFAERVAVNTPIQGTSADIIKKAMIGVFRGLREQGRFTRMLLQIHDELLFEVPVGELESVAPWIRSTMEKAVRLKVPVEVGLKAGPNWQQMESLKAEFAGLKEQPLRPF